MNRVALLLLFACYCAAAQDSSVLERALLIANTEPAPAAGGGGGPTNYSYTVSSTDNSFGTGGTFIDYAPVTNGTTGTLKELTFDCFVSGNETVKIALFTSTSNLIAGASGSIVTSAANEGTTVHVPIAGSISVSSGTVYIISVTSSSGTLFRVNSKSGQTGYYKGSQVYASFPPATLPAADGTEGSAPRLGMGAQ